MNGSSSLIKSLETFQNERQSDVTARLCFLAGQDTGQFSPANNADPLHGGLAILHGNLMGIFHFPLILALYTICSI